MIELTQRLTEGIDLVNRLDDGKLSSLLSRLFTALNSSQANVFTAEQKKKLETSLNITHKDVDCLIDALIDIILKAGHGIVRPHILRETLLTIGLNESLTGVIVEQWTIHAKTVVDKLRQLSISEKQLTGISWDLHIETASSSSARQCRPIVNLQLDLAPPPTMSHQKITRENHDGNVILQMNQQQLYGFYEQLENIQTQLDALR